MNNLIADQLKDLWQGVVRSELSEEDFAARQESLLGGYRRIWTEALRIGNYDELQSSILSELCEFTNCSDLERITRRCQGAVTTVKNQWTPEAAERQSKAIVQFYDQTPDMIFELMWWHTLGDDVSPLAYVTALQFAKERGCRAHLDFGSGVGSGSILFARHGFTTALADISGTLQAFCRWRMARRGLSARFLDLKTTPLPARAFDFITAMDVFEHLPDPAQTVLDLDAALLPGGYLFARLHADMDEDRPQHIVEDFEPTFRKLNELGYEEVWRDEWLWGHQVYRKPAAASRGGA